MASTFPAPIVKPGPVDQSGWLQCAYQPVRRLDGTLVRYEALLRPHGGSPDAVLARHRPGPARTALTLAVIDTVLADQPLLGAPVAVNVDAADLQLVAELVALWTSTGRVDPTRLAVEVTEHRRPTRDGFDALCWLADLGYGVAFDDVGTGVWTVDDVTQVPGAEVKLAPEVWACPPVLVAWSAVFDGRLVLVEGVEDLADLPDWADLYQGYAGGRPAPAEHWAGG